MTNWKQNFHIKNMNICAIKLPEEFKIIKKDNAELREILQIL